jgi:hypothetical protein
LQEVLSSTIPISTFTPWLHLGEHLNFKVKSTESLYISPNGTLQIGGDSLMNGNISGLGTLYLMKSSSIHISSSISINTPVVSFGSWIVNSILILNQNANFAKANVAGTGTVIVNAPMSIFQESSFAPEININSIIIFNDGNHYFSSMSLTQLGQFNILPSATLGLHFSM